MVIFNAFGHLMIGFFLSLVFAHSPLDTVIIVFCSLLPDIDHPQSTLGRYNPFARLGWVQHRGFTHSVIGIFVFSLPFIGLGLNSYWMAVLGYGGHVFGDLFHGWMPNKQSLHLRIW